MERDHARHGVRRRRAIRQQRSERERMWRGWRQGQGRVGLTGIDVQRLDLHVFAVRDLHGCIKRAESCATAIAHNLGFWDYKNQRLSAGTLTKVAKLSQSGSKCLAIVTNRCSELSSSPKATLSAVLHPQSPPLPLVFDLASSEAGTGPLALPDGRRQFGRVINGWLLLGCD